MAFGYEGENWRTDSDVPSLSAAEECRLGDLKLAFVMDKDVANEHAPRRRSDMREQIGAQTRKDPGASVVTDGGGPVLSARVTEK